MGTRLASEGYRKVTGVCPIGAQQIDRTAKFAKLRIRVCVWNEDFPKS